jgi:hypothetical protein
VSAAPRTIPARVLCDLAVMLADGGRCLSDIQAMAGQASLFGELASISIARRMVRSVGESELEGIHGARARASGRARKRAPRPSG